MWYFASVKIEVDAPTATAASFYAKTADGLRRLVRQVCTWTQPQNKQTYLPFSVRIKSIKYIELGNYSDNLCCADCDTDYPIIQGDFRGHHNSKE